MACEHQVGVIASSGNITEMCSNAADTTMKLNRTCFLKLIESIRFLARPGLAMQGHTDAESNFNQLLKLRANDVPLLTDWLHRKNDKYTSHDSHVNILNIRADTIEAVIKDMFTRLGLSFSNCRGQCYDGASNMLGSKSGVATRILQI